MHAVKVQGDDFESVQACVGVFVLVTFLPPSRSLLCLCNPCKGAQIVIMLVETSSDVLVINVSLLQVLNFRPQAII